MGPAAVAEAKRERPAGRAATSRLRGSAAPRLRSVRASSFTSAENARAFARGDFMRVYDTIARSRDTIMRGLSSSRVRSASASLLCRARNAIVDPREAEPLGLAFISFVTFPPSLSVVGHFSDTIDRWIDGRLRGPRRGLVAIDAHFAIALSRSDRTFNGPVTRSANDSLTLDATRCTCAVQTPRWWPWSVAHAQGNPKTGIERRFGRNIGEGEIEKDREPATNSKPVDGRGWRSGGRGEARRLGRRFVKTPKENLAWRHGNEDFFSSKCHRWRISPTHIRCVRRVSSLCKRLKLIVQVYAWRAASPILTRSLTIDREDLPEKIRRPDRRIILSLYHPLLLSKIPSRNRNYCARSLRGSWRYRNAIAIFS